jgi:hypothetical protein
MMGKLTASMLSLYTVISSDGADASEKLRKMTVQVESKKTEALPITDIAKEGSYSGSGKKGGDGERGTD